MPTLLATLSPDAAVVILTAGAALIALELNRPGSVLPGAVGLLLSLLAAASLLRHHPSPDRAIAAVGCLSLLLLQARRKLGGIAVAVLTLGLIFALGTLIPPAPGPEISDWAAVGCGISLGTGTTVLTRIARRARQNKGLD